LWYDTTSSPNVLKVYNGTGWELTVPVSVKKQYRNAGGSGFIAVSDAGTALYYNNRSYIIDTAFNDKAEVYLNGVRLLSTTGLPSIGTTNGGDYWHDASTNRVYFEDLPQATDVLEIVTHSGSFSTAIAASEAQAITSAAEAVVSASTATTQAGIATTKAGEAAASAVTAAAQVPLATAQKTAAVNAKDLAVIAKNAAVAAKDLAETASTSTAVVSVSNSIANVNTVAANITPVTSVHNNIAAVQGAAGNASTATTKAGEAVASATAAALSASNASTTLASAVKVTAAQTIAGAKTFTSKATFTNATNSAQVILESTDPDPSSGPNLTFKRSSASPATGDNMAMLNFIGRVNNTSANGGGLKLDATSGLPIEKLYANLYTGIHNAVEEDVTANLVLNLRHQGLLSEILGVKTDGGATTETVINENGRDINFRVESDHNQHALFIKESSDVSRIGNHDSPQQALDIEGNIKSSQTLLAKDATLEDTTPSLLLKDLNSGTGAVSGTGFVFQENEDLRFKARGVSGDYGSVSFRTEDGLNNIKKNLEILANSDVKFYKASSSSSTSDPSLYFDGTNGRLGLGSGDVPTKTLDVTGDGKFSGSLEVVGDALTGLFKATKFGQAPIVSDRGSTGTIFEGRKDGDVELRLGYNGTESYFLSDGGGIRISSTVVKPTVNGFNFNDNAVDLGTSTNRFKTAYLSDGVVFGNPGGTTASGTTVTSETLDDYEEGDWTPTFDSTVTQPTISYSAATKASYTKIGNQVYVHGRIITNSVALNEATGNIRIAGLPFQAISTGSQSVGNGIIGRAQHFNAGSPSRAQVLNNSTVIALNRQTNIVSNMISFPVALLTEHDVSVSGTAKNDISFSAMYRTSS
jgi:hypothetical protein